MSSLPTEPWALSMVQTAGLIAKGELAPSELVASVLTRLELVEPLIQAFVSVRAQEALSEAREQDGRPGGPLRGMPVAVKDIFDLEGVPTRCGSAAYADAAPANADAWAVVRLRAAGAIVIGKTATHELACGVYTPPTRNPWDLGRSPGGSSGGSAAAVAACAAMGAIGSDTGGSIRIPASHCGLVGVKPTYGRVGRSGALTLSWSLDHVGPLARTVQDAALLLSVLAGPDPGDPTTLRCPALPEPLLHPDDDVAGMRVGLLRGAPFIPCEPETGRALERAAAVPTASGVTVEETTLPALGRSLPAEFAIVAAEAASYHETRFARAPELVGEDVRPLLGAGQLLPASLYLRAQRTRRVIQQAIAAAFTAQRLDAFIAPTVPAAAQRHGQLEYELNGKAEPVIDALVRTTAPFNLAGLPAVAVPTGISAAGLPGSVQIVSRPFAEQSALRLARAIERSTEPLPAPNGLEIALAQTT